VLVPVLLCMPVRAEGDGNGGGAAGLGHRDWGQHIDKALERVNAAIQKVQTGLANHPNAPADVKSAAGQLLTDLNALQTELTKVQTALPGKDKTALLGLKGQFKALHQKVEADRAALKAAVQAARQQRGVKGAGDVGKPVEPAIGL